MFYNPYEATANEGMRWLKANFHVHAGVCVKGECGEFPMRDVIDAYVQAGYHVLAVTNHNRYIPYEMERGDISLLDGVEYSYDPHMVLIGTNRFEDADHQQAINLAREQGGFVVLCHPNWQNLCDPEHPIYNYWTLDELERLTGYVGIEILNASAYNPNNWGAGSGLALDKWDHLLTLGRKIYGFGSDDFHYWNDLDNAFNMLYAKSAAYPDIKEAVEAGRFYVSTGVVLERFSISGGRISVKAGLPIPSYVDCFEYRFVGAGGKLLYESTGPCAEYTVDAAEQYVRVEVTAEQGAKMYLQPVLNLDYLRDK